jgi:predicted nucleic acid-binding Zn ribbon protein
MLAPFGPLTKIEEPAMYCSACGNLLSPGLSFCNRCGTSLKERSESKTSSINAFLTAITLIGVIGLGIMLGGAMALKNEAHLDEMLIGFFMLFTFSIVTIIEVLLVRQLSRFTGEQKQVFLPMPHAVIQNELPPAQVHNLVEPVTSVTENTTRTLEYANQPKRR